MNLRRKLERLEGKVDEINPRRPKAVIQGFVEGPESSHAREALDPDDPGLQQGVDAEGEAMISCWWTATFFDGTQEQQEARLKDLRAEPKFQKPSAQDGPAVFFEGGARCDDMFLRIYEREHKLKPGQNKKLISSSTS
jgi:hypothetical protein